MCKCNTCGKEFKPVKGKANKYCGLSCYHNSGQKRPSRTKPRINVKCPTCKQDFSTPEHKPKKYCCSECYRETFRMTQEEKDGVCVNCGVNYIKKNKKSTTCSKKCSVENLLKANDTDYLKEIECVGCKKIFKPRNRYSKYCSKSCLDKLKTEQRVVSCKCCGKKFKRHSKANKYCSLECFAESNKGANNSTFTNYIYDEHGYLRYTPNHPKYPKKYVHNILWHEANPGKACEMCGGEVEHVHHIDEDKKNNDLENLLGLCASCHLKLHAATNFFWQYR